VTVCQYGYPIGDVQDMWDSVQGLLISEPLELNGRYYTIRDLELLSEVIVVSRVTRSLVWMFLRTAPELGPVQSPEIALQGFLKELKASQERWSHLHYSRTPISLANGILTSQLQNGLGSRSTLVVS
jgi:hypothetical protein